LQNKTELFSNKGSEDKPQWVLAGPPPGPIVAKYDAYDPETYKMLCQSGEKISPEVVNLLWNQDLLHAIV
jgi:hypothetical protein